MNCEDCGSPVHEDQKRGELVCSNSTCSLVVAENLIDYSPVTQKDDEYLGPGGDGRGPGLSVPNAMSMTTRPYDTTKDASGRSLRPEVAQRMKYLTTVDSRVVSNKDRSTKRLQDAVRDVSVRLNATDEVSSRAFTVAQRAVASREFRGWEFSLIAGGAMYLALNETKGHVNLNEFLPAVSSVRPATLKRNVQKAYKAMKRIVGSQAARSSASDIAGELVLRLNLNEDVLRTARKSLAAMNESAVPRIDAGAAVYHACTVHHVELSQKQVAEAAGTSDVSLRSRLKEAGL